jgi:hypothetical protein
MRYDVIAIILGMVVIFFAVITAILILRMSDQADEIKKLKGEKEYLEWIVVGKERTIGYQNRRIDNLKQNNLSLGDENSRLRRELNIE